MAVSEILNQKGRTIVTANPQTTIHDAANMLASKKIGAIVIMDKKNKVCGIFSERDIVNQVAKYGSNAMALSISSCMTKEVVTCNPEDPIEKLMEIMTRGKFRHVPVIKDGILDGIISIGDVVKRKIEIAEREAEEMKRYISG